MPNLIAALMLGCSSSFEDTADQFVDAEADTDTDADADTDTDADADADTDTDTDTDTSWANPECEGYEGTPIPGATSYFRGDFDIDGDVVTGSEKWLLFANSSWQETGNDDCTIHWTILGTRDEPTQTCGSCDYSLSLAANVDVSLTDCPAGLWSSDQSFSTAYNVKIVDGSAIFYFAGSGNELATGTGSNSAAAYLTEATCVYF
jgi:hypothetical protein